MSQTHREITVKTIAKEVLGFETLETRQSDRLDFKDVHVSAVYGALRLAYLAGAHSNGGEAGTLGDEFDQQMLDAATRHFSIKSFEQRNSDRLDFHDAAVWSVKAALEEAYDLGLAAAKPTTNRQGPRL